MTQAVTLLLQKPACPAKPLTYETWVRDKSSRDMVPPAHGLWDFWRSCQKREDSIDHCVPKPFGREFPKHHIRTTAQMGWDDLRNGQLLAATVTGFDVLLTVDRNMKRDPSSEPASVLEYTTPRAPDAKGTRPTPFYVRVIGLIMSVFSLLFGLMLGWGSVCDWVDQLRRYKSWDLPEFMPFFAVAAILVVAGVVGILVVYTTMSRGKQGR